MATTREYHTPVLLKECIEGLAIRPDGIYVDATLGGGGHFFEIVARLDEHGTAIGIDRDSEAIQWAKSHLPETKASIILQQARFADLDMVLTRNHIGHVSGILLDLGVSSHQIDALDRGFNYLSNASLDMRMSPDDSLTATQLLKQSSIEDLSAILADFGEVQNSSRMARVLKTASDAGLLETSADLRAVLQSEYGLNLKVKVLAKVFQALRIAVNGELDQLKTVLDKAEDALEETGRLVVMSYHSLEDRIVKNQMRVWEEGEEQEYNPYARHTAGESVFKRITKKAVQASDEEIALNRRSRSVRLRVAARCSVAQKGQA